MGVRSVNSHLALLVTVSALVSPPSAAGQVVTVSTTNGPSAKPGIPPLTPDGHPDPQMDTFVDRPRPPQTEFGSDV